MYVKLSILCCWWQIASLVATAEQVNHDQRTPAASASSKVSYLEPGSIIDFQPITRHRGFFDKDLRTYCYKGTEKTLQRLFESVELQLDIEGDDYTQYEGATPAEVHEHYDERRSLFSLSLFSQKRARLHLSPFTQQCIGMETVLPYRIRLQQLRVDFWRVIQIVLGVALFVYAGQLSHNTVFYYITGVVLGICSSFMLVIWFSSKLVPRRPMMYGVLFGGWTIGVYIIQMLWDNLQLIVLTYRMYVFWYIMFTGLVSFFFCYRWGPPRNERSKNIIKWILQLMALALIYFASHFEEAAAAIMLVTVILYYFPRSWLYRARAIYMRRFPPKRRLLTSAEYYEVGVRETTRALEELRNYASSPECNQWKVMSRLKDPLRFASFVEGASHLRDEEILRFEGADEESADDTDDSHNAAEQAEQVNRSALRYRTHPDPIQNDVTDDLIEDEEEDIEPENYTRPLLTPNTSRNGFRVPTLTNSYTPYNGRLMTQRHYEPSSPVARFNHRTRSNIANTNYATLQYSDESDDQ